MKNTYMTDGLQKKSIASLHTGNMNTWNFHGEAWKSLTEGLIQKSFKICPLSWNPDGSENDKIMCQGRLGLLMLLIID